MTGGFGSMADGPSVRHVARPDVEALAGVLARAFDDDPIWTWMFPDETARRKRLPPMFRRFLRHSVSRGDTVRTDSLGRGAAIWRSPGYWRETRSQQVRLALAMAPLFRGAGERIMALGATAEAHHPDEPHWYLATLGTDPGSQGRGIGSALLADNLARCDRDGVPAYLETETEANVAFYAHHGFAVASEADVPKSGPHMWFMWRDTQG